MFLETAELRAKNRQGITMNFWKENVDRIILLNDKKILDHTGSVSHQEMEEHVAQLYEEYNAKRKMIEAEKADEEDIEELNAIEIKVRKHK